MLEYVRRWAEHRTSPRRAALDQKESKGLYGLLIDNSAKLRISVQTVYGSEFYRARSHVVGKLNFDTGASFYARTLT